MERFLTDEAEALNNRAQEAAREAGARTVTPGHLLAAMLEPGASTRELFEGAGFDVDRALGWCSSRGASGGGSGGGRGLLASMRGRPKYASELQAAVLDAMSEAARRGLGQVSGPVLVNGLVLSGSASLAAMAEYAGGDVSLLKRLTEDRVSLDGDG